MEMHFIQIVVFSLILKMCKCHWMCDLAGVACDDEDNGLELCFEHHFNSWIKYESARTIAADHDVLCAIECKRTGCLCLLYLQSGYQLLIFVAFTLLMQFIRRLERGSNLIKLDF